MVRGELPAEGFCLTQTAVGRVGLAWRGSAVVGVQLPERTPGATRARLRSRFGAVEVDLADAPAWIGGVARRISSVVDGSTADDLATVELDLSGLSPVELEVAAAARRIPPGATSTYGALAAAIGRPGAARAVGQALGRNRFPLVVPCHRITASDGSLGGFSAASGASLKLRLLTLEERGVAGQRLPLPFDFDAAVAHLRSTDPALSHLIDEAGAGPMSRRPGGSTFAALAEAIVHQQLSTQVGSIIYARLCALLPRPLLGPTAKEISRLSDEQLAGAGLSGAKLRALRDLAARDLAGELPHDEAIAEMDDDEVVERLVRVRGVGVWTVQMLLIFRLGRPDVFPIGDLGVRQGMSLTYGVEPAATKELVAISESWRPYRSVASWYMWRRLDL